MGLLEFREDRRKFIRQFGLFLLPVVPVLQQPNRVFDLKLIDQSTLHAFGTHTNYGLGPVDVHCEIPYLPKGIRLVYKILRDTYYDPCLPTLSAPLVECGPVLYQETLKTVTYYGPLESWLLSVTVEEGRTITVRKEPYRERVPEDPNISV